MVKLSSTKRVLSQFKGRTLAEVKYISSLGSGDEPQIKQALNKPHLKDGSARAQARLARQYVKLIETPTPDQVKHVHQITGKVLIPNPPHGSQQPNPNAISLGNIPASTGTTPSTKTPAPKQKSQPTPPKSRWKRIVVFRPNPPNLPVPLAVNQLQPIVFRAVSVASEKEYQVIVFMQMSDGTTQVVSSTLRPTTNLNGVAEAFTWIIFTPGGPSLYKGKVKKTIDRILKVVVRFR